MKLTPEECKSNHFLQLLAAKVLIVVESTGDIKREEKQETE